MAAYTCSKIWAPGTLASAAFTPVLIALVKEALRRPAVVVTTVVPIAVPRHRRRPRGAGFPGAPSRVTPPAGPDMAEPALVTVTSSEVIHPPASSRRLRWRLAVITGLLGFAVCAAFYTVPELLAGSAASGGGRTTLWGGGRHHVQRPTTTSTTTVVVPGKTVTKAAPTTTTPASTTTSAPATPTTPPTTTSVPSTSTPAAPPVAPPTPTTSTTPSTP